MNNFRTSIVANLLSEIVEYYRGSIVVGDFLHLDRQTITSLIEFPTLAMLTQENVIVDMTIGSVFDCHIDLFWWIDLHQDVLARVA